jgi:WD40 repeat protein
MKSLKPLKVLRHGRKVRSAQWNHDASRILSASEDKTARIWNAQRGRVLGTLHHKDVVVGGRWDHNGSRVLTWSRDGTIQIWDAASGQPCQRIVFDAHMSGATWNGDESHLAFWYTLRPSVNSENPFVSTWRIHDLRSRQDLCAGGHGSFIRGVRWSHDDSRLLTWSADGRAVVWPTPLHGTPDRISLRYGRVPSYSPLLDIRGHEKPWIRQDGIHTACWNQDESRLLIASGNGTAQVWDIHSRRCVLTVEHEESVRSACWNSDENRLLTASFDGTAQVWDAQSGDSLLTLSHGGRVLGASWNGVESRILTWSVDGAVRIWDAQSGVLCYTLPHPARIMGVARSYNDCRILTWAEDGRIRIWRSG